MGVSPLCSAQDFTASSEMSPSCFSANRSARPLGSPAAPPIYRRFEQFGVRIFKSGAMLPILNALKGDLVLPNGISLGKKDLMIYTLVIEDFQENSYASRLQSSGVAATVGA